MLRGLNRIQSATRVRNVVRSRRYLVRLLTKCMTRLQRHRAPACAAGRESPQTR